MIKKIISCFLLCSILLLTFGGCTTAEKVKINGVGIDPEVVAYFETTLEKDENVKDKVSRYVAVNSEFQNKELTVPGSKRKELSEHVNDLWHLYGAFYEKNNISKETIYKIELSKVYEGLILENRYSKNGELPLKEKEIKAYFRDNFASIRFVTGYLFNVSEDGTSEMTDEQKKALLDSFKSTAETINNGTDIEEAVALLGSQEIHNTVVSSSEGGNFPEGFFDEVKKLETGKAAAFTLGSYVFLVERMDAEDGEFACYSDYRSDCLYGLKGEEFESYINELAKQYK